jgi:hypothetical protein
MPIEAHNNSSQNSSSPAGNTAVGSLDSSAFLKLWIPEILAVSVGKITRVFNNNLYLYTGALPFTTVSITTEIETGIWVKILTGSEIAFTQTILDSLALKSELAGAIAALVDSSPETLDTLKELATSLGNDANFATTTATALGMRLRFDVPNQNLSATQINNAIMNLHLYDLFYTKTQIQNLLVEIKIQGLLIQREGKTNLSILQNNDLFRYQTTDRYCVGVILDASNLTLPDDLDNSNKIKLQYDA